MKNLYLLALSIPVLVLLLSISAEDVASMGSVGGRPADSEKHEESSSFRYDLNPGEKEEDTLLVINNREESQNVLVYAADSMRSSSGGFALRQQAEEKEAVGDWVTFYSDPVPEEFQSTFEEQGESILNFCALGEEEIQEWCEGQEQIEFEIEGESQKEIPFTFSVDEDAEVGEHTGGILIQKAQQHDDDHEGTGIRLRTRVGVRIYQTVPGDIIKELELEEFSVKKQFDDLSWDIYFEETYTEAFLVNTQIANKGNVSTYFNQTIDITDELELFEDRSEEITDRRFKALRDDVRHSNYTWENPRFGKFTFETSIGYEDEDGERYTIESEPITIWIIPWREIIVATAIIVLAIATLKVRGLVLNKKYGGKGWVEYTTADGDTLDKLASKHNTDWKTIARTNNLKPPYVLKKGQKILVPPRK